MDGSGDIEFLEKQVSLLEDLLGNLDRRRARRRREKGDAGSAPVEDPRRDEEMPRASSGSLRLVNSLASASPAEPGRKPHFRDKRRWDLSDSRKAPGTSRPVEGPLEAPSSGPEDVDLEGGQVPWRLFQDILRQRDDLLVQLTHHQAAEGRLMEERAAGEIKDREIRRLRRKLEQHKWRKFHGLVQRLGQQLLSMEELERSMVRRALDVSTSGMHREALMAEAGDGKQVLVRGHEILVATSRDPDGGFYSFAQLNARFAGRRGMKGFKAVGKTEREAELACIDRVLSYLEERHEGASDQRLGASRNMARIRGREVDIFCDLVADGTYQAFPFLCDRHGRRKIIMQFHLEEAITAPSPDEARIHCVRRLESYFDEKASAAQGAEV
jgi:hypothetical protein